MRLLIRATLAVLTFTLILSLTCIGASPTFAQSILQQSQNLASYTPSHPNLKDEQNIDFLYDLYEANRNNSEFLEALSETDSVGTLSSRKDLAEFYYSPDDDAFKLREFMKLLRAVSCKVSRLTGVRGIDLTSKGIDIAKGRLEQNDSETIPDYGTMVEIWKSTYDHFCPDLW